MRKLLFIFLSMMVFPALANTPANLCTPRNPILTLKPGKVAVINGQETCVSGSCVTFATSSSPFVARAIAINPIAPVNLMGAVPNVEIDFATIQTSAGIATLRYVPGPGGTNGNGDNDPIVCERYPLWFTVYYGESFVPRLFDAKVNRTQFRGNTFRSTIQTAFIGEVSGNNLSGALGFNTISSTEFSWTLEGTYTPIIPGPDIDAITPSASQYLFALFGSGFTAGDVIEIDGSVIFTKQFHDSKTWFIVIPADGSVKPPFHVRLTNPSGTASQSTITEIATPSGSEY